MNTLKDFCLSGIIVNVDNSMFMVVSFLYTFKIVDIFLSKLFVFLVVPTSLQYGFVLLSILQVNAKKK